MHLGVLVERRPLSSRFRSPQALSDLDLVGPMVLTRPGLVSVLCTLEPCTLRTMSLLCQAP